MNIKGKRISLEFASKDDMLLVYELLVAEDIVEYMFSDEYPSPTKDEFYEDEIDFFNGLAHEDGNYLLIKYKDSICGAISYANGYEKIVYSEFDIWLKGSVLGLGLGKEALLLLQDFIHKTFKINNFIIRPWIKNQNAIRSYEKCGYEIIENFDASLYYDAEDFEDYGEGDYGIEETVNMLMRYN